MLRRCDEHYAKTPAPAIHRCPGSPALRALHPEEPTFPQESLRTEASMTIDYCYKNLTNGLAIANDGLTIA